MFLSVLALWGRTSVAWVFTLTALWKVRNATQFGQAVESWLSDNKVRRSLVSASWIVVPAEIIAAITLVLSQTSVFGLVESSLLLVIFTAYVATAEDLSRGCGCWQGRGQIHGRLPLLCRNAVLLILLTVGSMAPSYESSPAELTFSLGAGLITAMLVLQLPQVWTTIVLFRSKSVQPG